MCAEWDFVAINAGYGDSGFFFNETGLQWDEYPGTFGGWLGGFFLFFFFPLPFSFLRGAYSTPPRYPLPTSLFPSSPSHLASSSSSFRFVTEESKGKAANELINLGSLRLVPRHPAALLDKGVR